MDQLELVGYAGGGGCISLTWQDENKHAVTKEITRNDAALYISRRRNFHLFLKGWRPMLTEGRWNLVKMYDRKGPNVLEPLMDTEENRRGVPFTYTIDPSYNNEFEVRYGSLNITAPWPELPAGVIEVKNMGIVSSIAYFLTHEKAITPQLAEAIKFKPIPLHDDQRAKRVAKIIKGYAGEDYSLEANIKDVLTDLRHLCEKHRLDFDQFDRTSAEHFRTESAAVEG